MVDINTFLLMLVFMVGLVLLVFLIILAIKLINTIDRVNGILNQVDEKISKLDNAFRVVDVVTDNMALVSDKLVDGISKLIRKLFNKKRNGKEEENNEQ